MMKPSIDRVIKTSKVIIHPGRYAYVKTMAAYDSLPLDRS